MISISNFGGMVPRTSNRLLPDNFAQKAVNTDLLSGELRGLGQALPVHTLPTGARPRQVWRIEHDGVGGTPAAPETWVWSRYDESALVKNPLTEDKHERWYLFEPGQPAKVNTYANVAAGQGFVNLALQSPTSKIKLNNYTPSDPANVEERVYIYTLVSSWGEETSPSPLNTLKVTPGDPAPLRGMTTPPPPAGRAWEHLRVYRTVSGQSAVDYYFVADLPPGTTSWTDREPSQDVVFNETLRTFDHNAPVDGIMGVRLLPSGSLIGYKDRDIYFSKPYLPHAWPENWKLSMKDEVVGLGVFGQNVAVMTKSRPAILYGTNAQNMGILSFDFAEPCVNHGSIVEAPEGIYYAGHQGLVLVNASQVTNITSNAISRREWEAEYITETRSAVRYGTEYLSVGNAGRGFVINSLEARVALSDLFDVSEFTFFSKDLYNGNVYTGGAETVYRWDHPDAEPSEYYWHSKLFTSPTPIIMSVVEVAFGQERSVAKHTPRKQTTQTSITQPPSVVPKHPSPSYDWNNEVYVYVFADGTLVWEGPVSTSERLPAGFKASAWEVAVTGRRPLASIELTPTPRI